MRRTAVLIGLCVSLAVCAIAVAATDVVIKGATYRGHTKQGYKISFKVDDVGDTLKKLKYKLIEQCSNGTTTRNEFSQPKGASAYVQEDERTFRGTIKFRPTSIIKSGEVRITGHFVSSHKATGKIKDTTVFRKSDPNHRGTCSGQSKFTVKA